MSFGARWCGAGFLMLFVVAAQIAPGGQTLDRVIAKLNEEVILASDLADVLREKRGYGRAADPVAEADTQAVKTLLDRKLLLTVARRSVADVPQGEIQDQVEAMVAEARSHYPSKEAFLKDVTEEYGSLERFKQDLARRATEDYRIGRAVASRFTVTDSDVAEFEAECRRKGTRAESFRLRRIGVAIDTESTRGREKALARVANVLRLGTEAHLSFEETARRYSEIPEEAAMGGDLGYIPAEKLAPEVLRAVEKLEPGQVTPPLVTGNYACVFYVDAKRGARSALYERRFLAARETLLQEHRRKASLILYDKRLASKIPAEYKHCIQSSVVSSSSTGKLADVRERETYPSSKNERRRRGILKFFSH